MKTSAQLLLLSGLLFNGELAAEETPRGKVLDTSATYTHATPANTEAGASTEATAPPLRITVDGVLLEDPSQLPAAPSAEATHPEAPADSQRQDDVKLASADIQIQFDAQSLKPALNAWVWPRVGVRRERVEFLRYSNYEGFIAAAEIRIFTIGQNSKQTPLLTLPFPEGAMALTWELPADLPEQVHYVLRVRDASGRFDETLPKRLEVVATPQPSADPADPEAERLVGWGENNLAVHNLAITGGTVTVNGRGLNPGEGVLVGNTPVPVDRQGRFAHETILPPGPHTVNVVVLKPDGQHAAFSRSLSIADESWFYVAMADLTAGAQASRGPIELVTQDLEAYDDDTFIRGRTAFYLKGKIRGKYLLTASADTQERPIGDLFTNFDSKDPRYLLRRIDPDRFYPVYGDDSTLVDDAPTQGKFYVRIDRGDSHVMWGNFRTQWIGSEILQYNRGLYGANALWRSPETTRFGERKGEVNAFAAEPGTLQSREEFRGTGGSLYYLRHQDLTQGSERVWVEERDRDSGLVLSRRELLPAQDFDINYIQGRLNLLRPLASTSNGNTLVQLSSQNGNPLFLVVNYEYVPGLSRLDDLTYGGRASRWLNDHVGIGATGYRQETGIDQQSLTGIDLTLRYRPGTYVRTEIAHSDGAGPNELTSLSGGFDFAERSSSDASARAERVDALVDFSELFSEQQGQAAFYWFNREQGFSAPGQFTATEGVRQVGGRFTLPFSPRFAVDIKADHSDATSQERLSGETDFHYAWTPRWSTALGLRADHRDTRINNASAILSEDGDRLDGVVRLDYFPTRAEFINDPLRLGNAHTDWNLYGYAQGTLSRSGNRRANDRLGLGLAWPFNDRLRINAEVSNGDGGLGGLIGGDYRIDDRSNAYLNYVIETEREDVSYRGRHGTFTTGSRYRVSDQMSVFGETRAQAGAGPESLTHAYGLDIAANDRWNYGLSAEVGRLSDPFAGDLERRAGTLTVGYRHQETRFASSVEYRDDDSNLNGERRTWLTRNSFGRQLDPAWRLIAKADVSLSDGAGGGFADGDYTRLVFGTARRPVQDDRWNGLFKYTYFYDLPSPGQVTREGTVANFAQASHVLSADSIYDVLPWLSLGGKYGLRVGRLKDARENGTWFQSRADLFVVRADLHFIKTWDVVIEGRTLSADELDDRRTGGLFSVHRHLGEGIKLGVGYNFTDYTDDLTDLSYNNRGVFFNLLGEL